MLQQSNYSNILGSVEDIYEVKHTL